MAPKIVIAATMSFVLAGCMSTGDETGGTVDTNFVGDWIIEASADPETGSDVLFATLFPETGFDEEILWLGLICDESELEVGFGLTTPYSPSDPLVITTQIEDGPVIDRQGDFFGGDGAVIGYATTDVAMAFLDELASGFALTATADSDGNVRGPALFDITGAAAVAQQIRRDCF